MNRNIDLMKKIQLAFNKLSKGQRLIAQYILSNYEKAAFMTAAKLGDKVGVSESTVVRFANALEYKGYPQLQKELQEMIKTRLTTVQRIEMSTDYSNEEIILKNVLKADMENIILTLDEIDFDVFNSAVQDIVASKNVYIIGLRSSTVLAEFLGFYLSLIRENVHVVTYSIGDIYEQLIRLNSDDAVIGISFPRYSTKTIDCLDYAKSTGAKVTIITDSILSPLASYGDNILIAKSNMESFVDSLVAPMSVLNALILAVGIKEKKNLSDSFSKLEEIWQRYNVYSIKQNK